MPPALEPWGLLFTVMFNKVFIDSPRYSPRGELIEKHDIHLVLKTIIFGKKVYRDGTDLAPQGFGTLLEQPEELPATSAPSPHDFYDAYQKLILGAK